MTTEPDPVGLSRDAMRPTLPKRFYAGVDTALAEGGYAIRLDGRSAKTPGRRGLVLPTLPAAEAIAAEWSAQKEFIEPLTMPLTRLANSALDTVLPDPGPIVAEIVKYAGSDLLCYRADGPDTLVARQVERWDPVLAWADQSLGARFLLSEGVMYVEQPATTLSAVEAAVRTVPAPFALAALHVLTTLSGSAVLALAVGFGAVEIENAWALAHIDEDHQIERWGDDEEASARRRMRFLDFSASARLFALLRDV